MALQTADAYASFDVTAGAYLQDISPALADAIYYDLNFLEAIPLGWDSPVDNTVYIWNEDALNANTVVSSASITSAGVTLSVTAVTGRVAIGALLIPQVAGSSSTEVLQVTAISTLDLTVTRAYGGTTAASYATAVTFNVIDAMQEASGIGSDTSITPTVRQNNTHIFGARDLVVSGTQLARKMATTELEDFVGHQLANRTIEMKIKLITGILYSEGSSSDVGSDSVYRTMKGVRNWFRASGLTEATGETMTLTVLNRENKRAVDLGVFPDTLVVPTGMVASLAAIEASNRRLYESDTAVGYKVTEIDLDQGNSVRIVIDSRMNIEEAFMFERARVMPKPMAGRGMFTIAATDFTDARKRRVLAEWTLQVNNPEVGLFMSNKA